MLILPTAGKIDLETILPLTVLNFGLHKYCCEKIDQLL